MHLLIIFFLIHSSTQHSETHYKHTAQKNLKQEFSLRLVEYSSSFSCTSVLERALHFALQLGTWNLLSGLLLQGRNYVCFKARTLKYARAACLSVLLSIMMDIPLAMPYQCSSIDHLNCNCKDLLQQPTWRQISSQSGHVLKKQLASVRELLLSTSVS